MTTCRRKLWFLASLGRGLGPQVARALSLSMLGINRGVLATFGLPPHRLPLADQPQAFRVLVVRFTINVVVTARF